MGSADYIMPLRSNLCYTLCVVGCCTVHCVQTAWTMWYTVCTCTRYAPLLPYNTTHTTLSHRLLMQSRLSCYVNQKPKLFQISSMIMSSLIELHKYFLHYHLNSVHQKNWLQSCFTDQIYIYWERSVSVPLPVFISKQSAAFCIASILYDILWHTLQIELEPYLSEKTANFSIKTQDNSSIFDHFSKLVYKFGPTYFNQSLNVTKKQK